MRFGGNDISSIKVGSTTITKVMKGDSLYWGQIPNSGDALFWLNGTIIDVSGTKYFEDQSGNLRNFLITNYDFDSTWTIGFPYKSAATISAPEGDATLIAEDINNYLYDSGGTPNQIPVVSLFQDVDYEHKLFTRHAPQVLDGNGVETYEPRVLDVVLYNTVKTATALTNCQTYYGVPVESGTALWVSKTGNDTTGDGSKINPVATIAKAMTLTGSNIYIKTGEHDVTAYVLVTKNIKALGLVRITNTPTTYCLYVGGDITISGLFINNIIGDYPYYIHGSYTPTIDKNYITGYKTFLYAASGATGINITNTVLNLSAAADATFSLYKKALTINTCKITTSTTPRMVRALYTSNGIQIEINNCKLNSSATNLIETSYNCDYIKIKGNNITNAGIIALNNNTITDFTMQGNSGAFKYINGVGTGIGTFTICDNNLTGNSANPMFYLYNKNANFYNNIINITGTAGFAAFESTTDIIVNMYNNRLVANGDASSISIGISGLNLNKISGAFYNNYFAQLKTNPANVHGIQVLNNNGYNIYRNNIQGVLLGIVYKGDSHDYSNSKCTYNIVHNGYILVKGGENLNITNNTVVKDNDSDYPCIYIMKNVTGTANNNNLYNNIIKTTLSSGTYSNIYIEESGMIQYSNNNILYSLGLPVGKIGLNTYDLFSDWNSAGFDLNGYFNNITLSNYVPSPNSVSIGNGYDLGVSSNTGLDASTDWGSDTEVPTVVTKQQGASWDIGAYIH